ncbi:MAG: hypothetical protein GY812_04300 [Actinomycetia bacterium]|nr:hypothetical protein [Actinomycetes bacterium]
MSTDWIELTRRAAFASHRLIGWIYWDPVAIEHYAALGVPDGMGYYIATRGASLAPAGPGAVTAAFGSIHPGFVKASLDMCTAVTTFEAAAEARNAGVVAGIHEYAPEIADGLAALAEPMWATADSLDPAGRVLFASLRDQPRPDDALLSAWLAVNCVREWRGDTHWAMHIAADVDGTMAGILDGAWRNYDDDWLPRSRGADDAAMEAAMKRLQDRGFAAGGEVTDAGIAWRVNHENELDRLCSGGWQHLGEANTLAFLDLVEPVGDRFMERIDETAGPKWMPAGRDWQTRK